MTAARRTALFAMTLLVIGMIVRDPHQAHRPPEQRAPGVVVMVDPRTA
ncbi:MAG: hypothetical protein KIT43_01400 [Bauldia sp.]|nr:hypothetical protein [Bauldia sp.]MCW5716216.1 hypothetical protein [Bauldia sp.]